MEISYIKNKIIKENGKIFSILYLRNRFPDILEFINNNYNGLSMMEKIYKVVNNILETPVCISCNTVPVKFKNNYSKGYHKHCSLYCSNNNQDVVIMKKETMMKKYGVENSFISGKLRDKIYDTCKLKYGTKTPIQNKEIRKKYEETMVEKYGVRCNFTLSEVQKKVDQTNIKKYGVKRPIQNNDIKEKIKKTNLEKYGSEWIINSAHYMDLINKKFSSDGEVIENIFQSEIIKEKIKKTMIEKYGVENIIQNEKYFYQINFKSYAIKKYKDSGLFYQSTYEFLFLENMERNDLLHLVKNGLRFNYLINEGKHYYFSDFYIPKMNMIVEIKSSWTYDKNGKDLELMKINQIKKDSVISSGFRFNFLIGKKDILKFVNDILNDRK
jgi:hypothetical protein